MADRSIDRADRVYLTADRVVTAGQPGVLRHPVVGIENSHISVVRDRLPHQDGKLIDYGDATILPGFVDAHAHLSLFADDRGYEEMMLESNELMALVAVRNLRQHLATGVTTIRDNGARDRVTFHVRDALLRGYFVGPRLLVSGRPLTHTDGHFHFCHEVADGVEGVRRSVRRLVAEGADHIKIMASGGDTAGNQPFYPSYTVEELRAAVETAHELGRLTTAHCRSRKAIEYAIQAGLDCIEHAEFLMPAGPTPLGTGRIAGGVMQYDKLLADRLRDSGMFVSFTPVAGGYDTLVRLRAKVNEGEQLSLEETAKLDQLEQYYVEKLGILRRLVEDGFLPRLVISTDAGCFDGEFGRIRYGVELAVEAGMTTEQAISSVTRIAAEACGLGSQLGSVAAGKEADLLVVRGNPLNDVAALDQVLAVYRSGQLVFGRGLSPEPNDGAGVNVELRANQAGEAITLTG